MKRTKSVLLLLLVAASQLFSQAHVALSHFGRVHDLIYDGQRGLLSSAGEDGTLRIWDAEEKRLVDAVRISHRPVMKMALHPTEPHMAVLVGDADFASNAFLSTLHNHDLWVAACDWLARDQEKIYLVPRRIERPGVYLSKRQFRVVFFVTVIGMPFVAVILGFHAWWMRR